MGKSLNRPSPKEALGEFIRSARVPGEPGAWYVNTIRDDKLFHETVRIDGEGHQVLAESHQVLWSIGSGEHGKSYVVARGNALFQSPLSSYTASSKWDLSPGYANGTFRDFTRPVSGSCLFCHASSSALPPTTISCERCHGPGELHALRPTPKSIVNPARLPPMLRDDVCNSCHLGGEIRVQRAGKSESDFHPGTRFGAVVAIFSVPPSARPGGLDAVGQVTQLKQSRCWKASEGKLGCITCHNPHRERHGAEAAAFYRSRCLGCHDLQSCAAPATRRRATSPPDDCIACHMPRTPLNRVAHISHTNHRIPRDEISALEASFAEPTPGQPQLTCEDCDPAQNEPDLRSKALAYNEAAKGLPMFAGTALQFLKQAGRAYPDDADILAELGVTARDRATLQRAITLGSKSIAARLTLSSMLMDAGELDEAIRLSRESILLEPYEPAGFLALARIYVRLGDERSASSVIQQLQSFDRRNPGIPILLKEIER